MTKEKDQYVTSEVAKIFEVKNATVRKWVSRGWLKPLEERARVTRGGMANAFSAEEVKRFANERYGE